jgi:hypothetical protein
MGDLEDSVGINFHNPKFLHRVISPNDDRMMPDQMNLIEATACRPVLLRPGLIGIMGEPAKMRRQMPGILFVEADKILKCSLFEDVAVV